MVKWYFFPSTKGFSGTRCANISYQMIDKLCYTWGGCGISAESVNVFSFAWSISLFFSFILFIYHCLLTNRHIQQHILSTTCSFILFTKALLGNQNRYTHDHHLQRNKYTHTYSLVSSCASEEPIFPSESCCSLFFLMVDLFSKWNAPDVMGLSCVRVS